MPTAGRLPPPRALRRQAHAGAAGGRDRLLVQRRAAGRPEPAQSAALAAALAERVPGGVGVGAAASLPAAAKHVRRCADLAALFLLPQNMSVAVLTWLLLRPRPAGAGEVRVGLRVRHAVLHRDQVCSLSLR